MFWFIFWRIFDEQLDVLERPYVRSTLPGASKWHFDPQTLEVTNNLWKGHVNSPSQKGHQQNCQVYN